MGRGISLHIGVWDPARCRNLPTLDGPRCDALAMAAIAGQEGFEVAGVLLGDEAVDTAVREKLTAAARALEEAGGGTFFISFSGHGTQTLPNIQSWCLANVEWTEQMLHKELAAFGANVRVLVVSASCHSGGLGHGRLIRWLRARIRELFAALEFEIASPLAGSPPCNLASALRVQPRDGVRASVLFLASCGAGEKSEDGCPLTLFTQVLWDEWKKETATDYQQFINAIRTEVQKKNPGQGPTCAIAGRFPEWFMEKPFTH